jgi:2-acylglycerol O-acyltransferase 2
MSVLQFGAVVTSIAAQTGILGAVASFYVLRKRQYFLALAYMLNILLDKRPFEGGAPSKWFRESLLWKLFAEYFKSELVKTVNLNEGPYIFGGHPHGILALSAPAMWGSEGSNLSKVFPALDVRVAVVNFAFYNPISKDFALNSGCISANKESILHCLKVNKKSVVIFPGGADEALVSGTPDGVNLVLKDRIGFIKLALETGAQLVPTFTFGENLAYDQVFVPLVRKVQVYLMRFCGFSLPLFKPNYLVPLLPKRIKMVTVVGEPLEKIKMDPSDPNFHETAKKMHEKYIDALKDLHEKYKRKYGAPSEQTIRIISSKETRMAQSKL